MEELGPEYYKQESDDNNDQKGSTKSQWKKSKNEWKESWYEHSSNSKRKKSAFGFMVILFGVWWMMRRMNVDAVPEWVFTWPALLILIGIVHLLFHGFRKAGGFIAILIGAAFLAKSSFGIPIMFEQLFWPAIVILAGLIIIFKPKGRHSHKWKKKTGKHNSCKVEEEPVTEDSSLLDTIVFFGGVNRDVISKDFKGGELTAIVGGAELNFSKADIKDSATLDLTIVMGGLKMYVPRNWDVEISTTNIMGSVDDKRRTEGAVSMENKVLKLTGTVALGGIEIKSY